MPSAKEKISPDAIGKGKRVKQTTHHHHIRHRIWFKRTYQGRNIWDDPIIEKSQDQDQGQGQGQDHLLLQRAALPHFLVLALTLTLVLVLTLALAPSGMISKKGVPAFLSSTVLLLLLLLLLLYNIVYITHTHPP